MLPRRARVVLDTLLPGEGAHPSLPGAFEVGFDGFWDDFTRTAALPLRLGFRLALFVALWIAPLLVGRPPPLSMHARPVRERALDALARSRLYVLRQMMLLLKATLCFHYGAVPRVRDALGFPLQFDDPRVRAAEVTTKMTTGDGA
jgi:hypothetical protein